jgi:hypothetical protein
MKCSSCAHEDRDAAKFCEECAAPLGRRCARCDAELRPVAKFCDECAFPVAGTSPPPPPDPRSYTPKRLAEKILTSRSALEAGRLTLDAVHDQFGIAADGGERHAAELRSVSP